MSGFIKLLEEQVVPSLTGAAAGSLGSQIGYGLGELTGYNDSLQKRQLKQQQQLTNMQYAANYALMNESYKQQLNMWNKTNYPAQIQQMIKAGLNPALMYGHAGGGGTTGSGGASVGGGQASDTASMQRANSQYTIDGMSMMKLASEIKLNEAQAKKLNAEANYTSGAQTVTAETQAELNKINAESISNKELYNISIVEISTHIVISKGLYSSIIE